MVSWMQQLSRSFFLASRCRERRTVQAGVRGRQRPLRLDYAVTRPCAPA